MGPGCGRCQDGQESNRTTVRLAIPASDDAAGYACALSLGRFAHKVEAEQLSGLVGTIYDAAVERERWVDAVEQTCGFLNCCAGAFGAADFLQGELRSWRCNGVIRRPLAEFTWIIIPPQPINVTAFRAQIGGRGAVDLELDKKRELYRSDFYKEWLEPLGISTACRARWTNPPRA